MLSLSKKVIIINCHKILDLDTCAEHSRITQSRMLRRLLELVSESSIKCDWERVVNKDIRVQLNSTNSEPLAKVDLDYH